MSKRLLIISNRLPVQFREHNNKVSVHPSAGGLVSSIRSYLENQKPFGENATENTVLWIGSVDINEKKFVKYRLAHTTVDEAFVMEPVFLPRKLREKFYNGFCNDTLWPLFHYFPSYAKFPVDTFSHYVDANKRFCEKIAAIYRPGDVIWIHDYHLMLLPAMLRQYLPDAPIGFFLHIPFPSFELFRMLPGSWRKEILEGLLGADLVGFHTNSYAHYFLKSVREILGHENSLRSVITPDRTVIVDVFPVSIDFKKFNASGLLPEVISEQQEVKENFRNTKMVLSVDRLDYAKGITNRLDAVEQLLVRHPEYVGKITYVLVIVPSRDIIPKYSEIKERIEMQVSRINGKYGNLGWTPIVYQYRSIDFKMLCALYSSADVALITPRRDGMNLVAKEFVATRSDQAGVLVLSETAGAAAELGEAIIVNPIDEIEVADGLHAALSLSNEEQKTRMEFMQRRLASYDVVKWAGDFINELQAANQQQAARKIKLLAEVHIEEMLNAYQHAGRRLFMLDYDGTLVPIVKYPHLSVPSPQLIQLLKNLADDPKNMVVITSGRSRMKLQEWFGSLNIHLAAEHGCFIRQPGEQWHQPLIVSDNWMDPVRSAMKDCTDRCPGAFIEEKHYSIAWHYRNADAENGFARSRELLTTLSDLSAHLDFNVIEGKLVIETRPRGVDKGNTVRLWLQETHDFVFAAGDDRTDEDIFRSVPQNAYSIRVGLTQSDARFNVAHQHDINQLLSKMVALAEIKVPPKVYQK